jgi:hypothetical protein
LTRRRHRVDDRVAPTRRPAEPAAPEHPMLALQRTIGNQAVQLILARDA